VKARDRMEIIKMNATKKEAPRADSMPATENASQNTAGGKA
jgi:hypothetical protein